MVMSCFCTSMFQLFLKENDDIIIIMPWAGHACIHTHTYVLTYMHMNTYLPPPRLLMICTAAHSQIHNPYNHVQKLISFLLSRQTHRQTQSYYVRDNYVIKESARFQLACIHQIGGKKHTCVKKKSNHIQNCFLFRMRGFFALP